MGSLARANTRSPSRTAAEQAERQVSSASTIMGRGYTIKRGA
jgi:hypothetical protein